MLLKHRHLVVDDDPVIVDVLCAGAMLIDQSRSRTHPVEFKFPRGIRLSICQNWQPSPNLSPHSPRVLPNYWRQKPFDGRKQGVERQPSARILVFGRDTHCQSKSVAYLSGYPSVFTRPRPRADMPITILPIIQLCAGCRLCSSK